MILVWYLDGIIAIDASTVFPWLSVIRGRIERAVLEIEQLDEGVRMFKKEFCKMKLQPDGAHCNLLVDQIMDECKCFVLDLII